MDSYLTNLKKNYNTGWKGGSLEDRKTMFQKAKEICSQEGLSSQLTTDLLLTVSGESGWNFRCVNWNTLDFGIAQFSNKYYLVEYHMTPQEAIDNPLKCLRIMAVNFKSGRQSNWVAYANRKQHANQLIELSKPPEPILEEKKVAIENAKTIVPEVVHTNTPSIPLTTDLWISIWNFIVSILRKVI